MSCLLLLVQFHVAIELSLQEFDLNKDGYISPKEFRYAMQHQKIYARSVLCRAYYSINVLEKKEFVLSLR